jgi:DNA-binding NarL/FixJ family response regulator
MKKARVLLADDNDVLVEMLTDLLQDDYDLVGILRDGQALLEAAQELRPDVIVTDISMPLLSGLDVVRELKQAGTTIKIILLTGYQEPQLAASALREGASGYVLKHCAGDELLTALDEVVRGRPYITPLIARDTILFMQGGS